MRRQPRLTARGIVLTYALVAAAWIAFSDRVAAALFPAPDTLATVSTLKGWGFVAVTSVVLAMMLNTIDAERARRTENLEAEIEERSRAEAHLASLNRILRTLSQANEALVHAQDEASLLRRFCSAIVEESAYRGAWVGYREDDPDGTIRPVSWAGPLDEFLKRIVLSWHEGGQGGQGPAARSIRDGRAVLSRDVAADAMLAWRPLMLEEGFRSLVALPLGSSPAAFGTLVIYSGEPDAFGTDELGLLEELAADLAFGVATLRDRAAAATADAERRRLAAAIEQSGDAIVITDTSGAIEYVNPAFERITGYTHDEVLGQNPRILHSGVHSAAFFSAMWEALGAGGSWTSDIVNRRKDGTHFTEAAVITPVHDPAGANLGYVAVKRDVSAERAAETRAVSQAREQTLIAAALATVRPGASPDETATALCTQIARLPDAVAAILLAFDLDGRATPLGAVASDGRPLDRRRLAEARSRHLLSRAEEGPWIEAWVTPSGSPFSRAFRARGVRALAYVPLVVEGSVRGLLEAASAEVGAIEALAERLPALVEFAAIAGAVMGPALVSRAQVAGARARIRTILERRAFSPVFQPIVDLEQGEAVGFEALTRFTDGTPPDEQFRAAALQGLGAELEAATLRAALAAAGRLPASAWLSVNVSPSFVLAGEPLRTILGGTPRPIVLEVTEQQVIADYPAFRAALDFLGHEFRLAVDDAGAGFASLRHISELRPALVKVDRVIVADLDTDPVREALLAGLHHFAGAVGCTLIAEGIETEAELATLRGLGVRLGQGYLLGRPGPLPPSVPAPGT